MSLSSRMTSVKPISAHTPVIHLVAVDLDGTLLNDTKQVTKQTAEALAKLPQRGVKLVIASARPPRSVRHIYQSLGLDTWQINYNGALIWDEPGHKAIFHRPMNCRLVRQMIEVSRDMYEEVLVTCEIMDRWYTDRLDDQFNTETGKLFKPDVVAPIEEICTQPITKLLLLGEPRVIGRLEPMLSQRFGEQFTFVQTDDHMLQIMDKRVSKAVALEKVARHYRVSMEHVMAIGDAPNDVGMLQSAGVAVAMDNAAAVVKEVADWVAPSNNDHGVSAALRRYGLCE
ncbi:MAG: HAD family phosphatase [Phycisphaerales bacterium]|jgi:Cof subfamily protein (haloacid dehalogenase superfamily)|nr:HAD family phosphatase [Phycisphaerales bacterium]